MLLIISCNQFCNAMKPLNKNCIVTMPNEAELRKLFSEYGLDHFVEKTDIIRMLAGQKKALIGIDVAKELAMFDYSEALGDMSNFQKRILLAQVSLSFDAIINSILPDFSNLKNNCTIFDTN